MQTKEIIRCSQPADFLAALPTLVGFTSTNSVFLVPFVGNRASGSLRMDLPAPEQLAQLKRLDLENDAELMEWLGFLIGQVSFAQRVAVVIQTEETFASRTGIPPMYELGRFIGIALEMRGIEVTGPYVQAPDGYAELLPDSHAQCPLSDIENSPASSGEKLPTLEEWRASRGESGEYDAAKSEEWRAAAQRG